MTTVQKVARLIRTLEDQLVVCMRCGMCQAVCPLFQVTGHEVDVARGKLALLDGLAKELFRDAEGVSKRIHRCLLCGSCAAHCPSGVPVLDVFIKARAILKEVTGLNLFEKLLLRGVLAHPQLFDRLFEAAARLQPHVFRQKDPALETARIRFPSPVFGGERHVKLLAPSPFHAQCPQMDEPPGKSGLKVAFFVGCLIDKVFPSVAHAVVRVLRHHGAGIYLPGGQACCGMPAAASGDQRTFEKLVRHNLECFPVNRFDVLVTACGTCTEAIKNMWPKLLGHVSGDLRSRLHALSEKTLDIHQFLVRHLGVRPESGEGPSGTADRSIAGSPPFSIQGKGCSSPWGGRKSFLAVTYHDPCHLRKSLGVIEEPRIVLQAASHVVFSEMESPDSCCGLGGSFAFGHPNLSEAIGRRKGERVIESGCDLVATGCPACMIQLCDLIRREGSRMRVRHVVEVYAESISDP